MRALAQDRLSKIVSLQDALATLELQVSRPAGYGGAGHGRLPAGPLASPRRSPSGRPRAERLADVGPSRLSHPAVVQDVHNILLFLENHQSAFLITMGLSLITLLFTFRVGRRAGAPEGPPSFSNVPWLFRTARGPRHPGGRHGSHLLHLQGPRGTREPGRPPGAPALLPPIHSRGRVALSPAPARLRRVLYLLRGAGDGLRLPRSGAGVGRTLGSPGHGGLPVVLPAQERGADARSAPRAERRVGHKGGGRVPAVGVPGQRVRLLRPLNGPGAGGHLQLLPRRGAYHGGPARTPRGGGLSRRAPPPSSPTRCAGGATRSSSGWAAG